MLRPATLRGAGLPALNLLEEHGLLTDEDGDDGPRPKQFDQYGALVRKANELVEQLKDHPDMAVGTTTFDWVNDHTRSPATAGYDWMAALTIEELTAPTKDLPQTFLACVRAA